MNKIIRQYLDSLQFDIGYLIVCERKREHVAWVLAILFDLRWRRNRLICKVRGHDLEDHGYGGPESGCTDVGCNRCGFSYGKTWLY